MHFLKRNFLIRWPIVELVQADKWKNNNNKTRRKNIVINRAMRFCCFYIANVLLSQLFIYGKTIDFMISSTALTLILIVFWIVVFSFSFSLSSTFSKYKYFYSMRVLWNLSCISQHMWHKHCNAIKYKKWNGKRKKPKHRLVKVLRLI